MLAEGKTLIRISIDNSNFIRHELEISSIDQEELLRLIHSILDEMKLMVIERIQEINSEDDEDEDEEDEEKIEKDESFF